MHIRTRRRFLATCGGGISFIATSQASEARNAILTRVVRPEDFGGGLDGDDTAAFQRCAQHLRYRGGVLRLHPGRIYTVGLQRAVLDGRKAFVAEEVFSIRDCNHPIVVDGRGAMIRVANGLRFGSFDPTTGEPHHPDLPFTDRKFRVDIGRILHFERCASVQITDLDIDGNNSSVILGGVWGDAGRQCVATNIDCRDCLAVTITNVHSHHAALDNLYFRDSTVGPLPLARPVFLKDVVMEYAARQALSWTGGKGLTAINCKFNYTGRATNRGTGEPFTTSPAAGLDIEATAGAQCRDGIFIDCEFVNNAGPGMVADKGDSANCQFERCLFWGVTNRAIWPRKPGFKFKDCRIYGSVVALYSPDGASAGVVHPDAPQFMNCDIEDRLYENNQVHRDSGSQLLHFNSRGGWLIENSRIVVKSQRLGIVPRGVLRNTSITWASSDRPARDAVIRNQGAFWEGVTINDVTESVNHDGYYIDEGHGAEYERCVLNSPNGKLKWISWSADAGGFSGRRPATP